MAGTLHNLLNKNYQKISTSRSYPRGAFFNEK